MTTAGGRIVKVEPRGAKPVFMETSKPHKGMIKIPMHPKQSTQPRNAQGPGQTLEEIAHIVDQFREAWEKPQQQFSTVILKFQFFRGGGQRSKTVVGVFPGFGKY